MKKNVTIDMINNFYLNVCDKEEAARVINLLKNPAKNKLLTRIMKKQWDNINNENFQIDLNAIKYRKN